MNPLDVLKTTFGHGEFRGPQEDVIDHVLTGRHALVVMPTGMGKSLCYQIPALVLAKQNSASRPITLVLSPLIALMKDQVDALVRRGVDCTFINSSLKRDERQARYEAVREGHYDLLYVTPERFRKEDFREVLSARTVALLAVDEAHCISEWGHDFRPDYTRLREIRAMVGNPPTIALTATATPDVQTDVARQLGLAGETTLFHEGIDRPNLSLDVVDVWTDDDKIAQIESVVNDRSGPGIVYFALIKTLEGFSRRLLSKGIDHVCYHGDLDRGDRRRIQDVFMNGSSDLVLATNAFGMGVDKEDIRFVLHAEVPGSMESYYQEIGRAGRDGRPSQCRLLYDEKDLATQMEFLEWSNPAAAFYSRVFDLLEHDAERVNAFGTDWVKQQLDARHDFRLETSLAMLERYGAIEMTRNPFGIRVVAPLPEPLRDEARLEAKRLRDQKKLYALVMYARCEGDRKAFIHEYFGLPYHDRRVDAAP